MQASAPAEIREMQTTVSSVSNALEKRNIPHNSGEVTAQSYWHTLLAIALVDDEFFVEDIHIPNTDSRKKVRYNIQEAVNQNILMRINSHFKKNTQNTLIQEFFTAVKKEHYGKAILIFQQHLLRENIFGQILNYYRLTGKKQVQKEQFVEHIESLGYTNKKPYHYNKAWAFVAGTLDFSRIADFYNQDRKFVFRPNPQHIDEKDVEHSCEEFIKFRNEMTQDEASGKEDSTISLPKENELPVALRLYSELLAVIDQKRNHRLINDGSIRKVLEELIRNHNSKSSEADGGKAVRVQ